MNAQLRSWRQNLLEGFGKVGQEYQTDRRNASESSEQEFATGDGVDPPGADRYWELEFLIVT
jgi:hypothetical protein